MILNFSLPKRKRRNRCVICKELTWSTMWMTYFSPKKEAVVDGFHCEKCTEEHNKTWEKEIEAYHDR